MQICNTPEKVQPLFLCKPPLKIEILSSPPFPKGSPPTEREVPHYVNACLYGPGKEGKTKIKILLLTCGNIGTAKKMNEVNLAQNFVSNLLIQFVYQKTF